MSNPPFPAPGVMGSPASIAPGVPRTDNVVEVVEGREVVEVLGAWAAARVGSSVHPPTSVTANTKTTAHR